jgi:FixJ family two-component response regulator
VSEIRDWLDGIGLAQYTGAFEANDIDVGYAVLQFASAEAFLKSERLLETNCVISDVQMPGMSGLELQNKLIVHGYHLPVIFVTAFSEMRARAQALSAGAIGFLAKPFNDEELITCLNEALAVKGVLNNCGSPSSLRRRNSDR